MDLDWRILAAVVAAIVVGASVSYVAFFREDTEVLRLATTTSTYDSGLLDYILPRFEEEWDCEVDVIAAGSGQALEMGRRGDVDVLLVHSPLSEIEFVQDGYGESRTLVMYNSFVIVGPKDDPAGIHGASSASQAFKRIFDNRTQPWLKFVSRGDDSGTHAKELAVWISAGLNASSFSGSWYLSAGQGMGAVLDMCEQMGAYTLSDDATYYQRVDEALVPHLDITYQGDPALFNQYSVIPVNATKWPHVAHDIALGFVSWITSQDGQGLISSYAKYGQRLFHPNAPGYTASATAMGAFRAEGACSGWP